MDNELKDCPFCGGRPHIFTGNAPTRENIDIGVKCPQCIYQISFYQKEADIKNITDIRAVKLWNTRHYEQQLETKERDYQVMYKLHNGLEQQLSDLSKTNSEIKAEGIKKAVELARFKTFPYICHGHVIAVTKYMLEYSEILKRDADNLIKENKGE